jgi:hypothetical protein
MVQVGQRTIVQEDEVKSYSRILAALGTSYKLGNLSFAELEYRNFTVHGKTKETTDTE